jgi:hypothetical protein
MPIGGIRIGRGKRGILRKPAPVQLCPREIPHAVTWDRTWAAMGGSWQLTRKSLLPNLTLCLVTLTHSNINKIYPVIKIQTLVGQTYYTYGHTDGQTLS